MKKDNKKINTPKRSQGSKNVPGREKLKEPLRGESGQEVLRIDPKQEEIASLQKDLFGTQKDRGILKINRNFLNYENEERKKFSVKEGAFNTSRGHKSILIPPRPHFEELLKRSGSSIDLRIEDEEANSDENSAGCVRILYGRRALAAEMTMLEAASSGDPEFISECLKRWPTHPGSLLLLSIVDKNAERFSDSLNRIGN